jgi:hypothetical protein
MRSRAVAPEQAAAQSRDLAQCHAWAHSFSGVRNALAATAMSF